MYLFYGGLVGLLLAACLAEGLAVGEARFPLLPLGLGAGLGLGLGLARRTLASALLGLIVGPFAGAVGALAAFLLIYLGFGIGILKLHLFSTAPLPFGENSWIGLSAGAGVGVAYLLILLGIAWIERRPAPPAGPRPCPAPGRRSRRNRPASCPSARRSPRAGAG